MAARLRLCRFYPFIRSTSLNLLTYAKWIPALIFFNDQVGELAIVGGPSMYPYLNEGFDRTLTKDICWVSKLSPSFSPKFFTSPSSATGLKRGMVISLRSPSQPEVYAIKRVVGLPGDTVVTRKPYPTPTALVPAGHIWVEGDNARWSLDSNTYGPVPLNLVKGRVTWVVWPWRNWGAIRWAEWRSKTVVFKGPED